MDNETLNQFQLLVETIATLRSPEGCPWDRKQTHDSLKRHAIEETYEVIDAIESGDPVKLRDELGDLLLQVLLHAQMASEAGEFDIGGVCATLREKLLRRHPHVFADVQVSGVDDVIDNWEQIKRSEPGYDQRKSVLDGIPANLPALMRAAKISKKAARTGFDWPDVDAIVEKLREETRELEDALKRDDARDIEDEIGDVLFTTVNIARYKGIDPEDALRRMLGKFARRFARIEETAAQGGRSIEEMTLPEMDSVWNQAKQGNGN